MGFVQKQIINYLKKQRGMDFSGYRLSTLERRLLVRMSQVGAVSYDSYWERLISDPVEPDRLIDVFGVNVSHFFRNPLVFELIGQRLLPELIDRKLQSGSRELRIWSAGCGSGEEAYSLAILLHQALKKQQGSWHSYIFASDINGKALQQATQASYSREKLKNIRLKFLDDYFEPTSEGFVVRRFLRDMVYFSCDDLTSQRLTSPAESIYGSFDLIICRNVLIYFTPDLQTQVVEKLHNSLGKSGLLILGNSEMLPKFMVKKFQTLDESCRIWRKA